MGWLSLSNRKSSTRIMRMREMPLPVPECQTGLSGGPTLDRLTQQMFLPVVFLTACV